MPPRGGLEGLLAHSGYTIPDIDWEWIYSTLEDEEAYKAYFAANFP